MVTAAPADAQPDARELARPDVHAGRVAPAERLDAPLRQRADDRALDALDQRPHAEPRALEVEQRVDHQLARTVVGHLPAAVDLHDGDVAGAEQVLGLRVHAEREHRRVLEEPDLVGGVWPALVDERCIARQVGS